MSDIYNLYHKEKAMKKYSGLLLALFFCLLLLPAGCSDSESGIKVDETKLGYFKDSYVASRTAFLEEAGKLKAKYRGVEISKILVPSKKDPDLTIDYCYVPAQKNPRSLFIMTSGVHGIEAFACSAVQRMFMAELTGKVSLDEMGILLVHTVNPYGFKYKRKTTEHNVDMNRNCETDRSLFKTENKGYASVQGLVNPGGPVDLCTPGNVFFPVKMVYYIVKYGMKHLRQGILQGQYVNEKGFFFGGRDFEPQVAPMAALLYRTAKNYGRVLEIDLHTGYGARRVMHLFPNPIKDKKVRGAMETVFEGYRIDWGDTDDFYTVTGDIINFIGKAIGPGKFYLPMAFEYGTMDSQTTMGSIRSLKLYILENQLYQYGARTAADRDELMKSYLEMHCPASKAWRSEVMRQTSEILPPALKRFQELK